LHTLMEIFAVAVGAMVTAISWGTRRYKPSPRVFVTGSLLLGVCLLDVSHLLSYQGMPDFITPNNPEKSINFWLAARTLSVLALLVACAVLVMSEFFFTVYANVNDVYNLLGHVYKVAGYAFLFLALFVEMVRTPYTALAATPSWRATSDTLMPGS